VDGILTAEDHRGDLLEIVARLSRWLTDHITYSADPGVLASRRDDLYLNLARATGDCGTFSCTFTAMANAAGIPARVAMGMTCQPFVWPPDPAQPKTYVDRVGWHVWVEVFLPGLGWVELEPQAARRPSRYTTDAELVSDLFALQQYSQNQLTQAPLLEGWETNRAAGSVAFKNESDLVLLSGPRALAQSSPRAFPDCALATPEHGSRLVRNQPILLSASVTAPAGAIIRRVRFWVKAPGRAWQVHATVIAPPFSASYTAIVDGEHSFACDAEDSFGMWSVYSSGRVERRRRRRDMSGLQAHGSRSSPPCESYPRLPPTR
jgi:hypothetical protein